ncbi:ABC transporter permease [Nocardiopsis oceani]
MSATTPTAEGGAAPRPQLTGALPPRYTTPGWSKTWSDILVLTHRNLRHMARDPFEVIIALSMPLVMVLLFGYLFGDLMSGAGTENYRAYLVPAMLAMVMVNGIAGTAIGINRDSARDVMSRFRSMPMSPMAILGARTLTDMARACVEVALLLACGALMGMQFENGVPGILAAAGVLLLFRFALVWFGVLLGLLLPNPDAVGAIVYPLAMPLTMLSTAFVPSSAMPSWLAPVAEWNPLSAVVTAIRELFGGQSLPSDAWPAENALFLALFIPTAAIVVCVPLALRRFRRLSN